MGILNILHSEWPKLHKVFAFLSAVGLKTIKLFVNICGEAVSLAPFHKKTLPVLSKRYIGLHVGLFSLIARPVPDKATFTVCSIIKLATIAFDETSNYWSAPKSC